MRYLAKLLSILRDERTHQITEANQLEMRGCLETLASLIFDWDPVDHLEVSSRGLRGAHGIRWFHFDFKVRSVPFYF